MLLAINQDVCYSVESGSGDTVDLLHNISAFARSGTITALMGSSGAGRSVGRSDQPARCALPRLH